MAIPAEETTVRGRILPIFNNIFGYIWLMSSNSIFVSFIVSVSTVRAINGFEGGAGGGREIIATVVGCRYT